MTRYHATSKGRIPFTPEEEAAWDRQEAQAIIDKAAKIKAAEVAAVKAELDAADIKVIRAITEGDTARIEAHKAAQAVRRAKLQ